MSTIGVEVLNDLLLVNNDRIKGYERALKETKEQDFDLKQLFQEIIAQTKRFNDELRSLVEKAGAMAETQTSISGRLHRVWMDIKTTLSGSKRKILLAECERGEDASKEAYSEALHGEHKLTNEQIDLLTQQADEQELVHNRIRDLRNIERER